jgi:hypothetical protein
MMNHYLVSHKDKKIKSINFTGHNTINITVMDFIEELRWRGMVHDMMPGTGELLKSGMTTAYVGIDPTASSLHIGHLVSVMMLKHLQRCRP